MTSDLPGEEREKRIKNWIWRGVVPALKSELPSRISCYCKFESIFEHSLQEGWAGIPGWIKAQLEKSRDTAR
jgi:hypothetical protein